MPGPTADDRRIRVLTLTRDAGSGVGGVEVLVLEILRRIDPARFDVHLCVTREPAPARRRLAAEEMAGLRRRGVHVLELNRRSSRDALPYRRLFELLLRERIDIVHAHMPRASVPGVVLGRLARVPVVISHEHGSVLEGKRVRTALDRRIVGPGSDVVLAVSEWDRHNIIARSGVDPERVRVFRHGIVTRTAARDLRAELAPAGTALIGAVGRLHAVKGYDVLLRAVAELGARPVRCLIVGDGPERERLEALARALGIADRVDFPGFRPDIPEILEALDVAVLSSHSEGGPLAVMEYMAAGVPIVATGAGGVPELLDDGVHALLVAPGDPSALAAAIGRVLDDRELGARLADAAQRRQREEFDIDVTVRRLEMLYEELLARPNGQRTGRRRG